VALDRQSIEKKDFPIGDQGYDADAVDAHLSAVAAEVDDFRRTSRRRSETFAATASEQVRAIVEAAESSAAEIQRQAEEEARDIRAEATGEAEATRESATNQARDYVGKVSESTSVMLERLDAMESELSALIESLRTGSNRLNADLHLLEGNLGDVREAVAPRARPEPEPESEAAVPTTPETAVHVAPETVVHSAPEAAAVHVAPAAVEAPAVADEPDEPADDADMGVVHAEAPTAGAVTEGGADTPDGSNDTEGARLIALNMALNGTPREETERYLSENFQLPDREGLLDEVYASVES
jgi:F0F1-type ATP synthase membrane subunit b/b'